MLFPFGEPGWHRGIECVNRSNRPPNKGQQRPVIPHNCPTVEELLNAESSVFEENSSKTNTVSVREFYVYRFLIRPTIDSVILQSGRLLQQ
ncbi:hypothetical protein RHMOL_Rhmol07G0186500 [Rhododendron molle]|uniref:Uncharacterized protein n=1 Tax=Rhododendron molle TaxID=49168 RepID=A0ACC0N1Y5_RHOML|nr:hypothetical protein RHMOL_Rhmol07G0186500 [Rhododendron molle]